MLQEADHNQITDGKFESVSLMCWQTRATILDINPLIDIGLFTARRCQCLLEEVGYLHFCLPEKSSWESRHQIKVSPFQLPSWSGIWMVTFHLSHLLFPHTWCVREDRHMCKHFFFINISHIYRFWGYLSWINQNLLATPTQRNSFCKRLHGASAESKSMLHLFCLSLTFLFYSTYISDAGQSAHCACLLKKNSFMFIWWTIFHWSMKNKIPNLQETCVYERNISKKESFANVSTFSDTPWTF